MDFEVQEMQSWVDSIITIITSYGLSVLGAIAILIAGVYVSKWASKSVYKAMSKTKAVDEMLKRFMSSLVRYAILLFTAVAVLSQFGVQTASLVAVLGATGLAIGLALQGTLGHVAAGVMLLIFRPFKIGDYVEVAGHGGSVDSITLFTTELKTPDNVHIIIPNGKVWDSSVKNYSHNETRRVDLAIGISYEDSIDKAMKIMNKVITSDARVLKDPALTLAVSELADNSVNFVVRMWCDKADYWQLKWDMTQAIKEAFDKEGISIPYPQRTLHVVNAESLPASDKKAG